MIDKFLKGELSLANMTINEFNDMMSEWEAYITSIGSKDAKAVIVHTLNAHLKGVRNDNELQIISEYLKSA